jgi:hypothetical protein
MAYMAQRTFLQPSSNTHAPTQPIQTNPAEAYYTVPNAHKQIFNYILTLDQRAAFRAWFL